VSAAAADLSAAEFCTLTGLDPALTSREDAITGVLLPAMGMAGNE